MNSDLVLEIPQAIVEAIELADTPPGDDTVSVKVAYHHEKKLPPDEIRVLVYPLTLFKSGKNPIDYRLTCYVSIQRRCSPSETSRLLETIKYKLDLEEHLAATRLGTSQRVAYQQAEEETFLWLPEMLHEDNKYAGIFELNYAWRKQPETGEI